TLGEVVVNTALGFKKSAKSLSYSAQSIKPDELTTVKDGNFTNAITGKASNVTITQGSGGVGGATNIILRGNNSLSGSGQPLIVIDGIPTVNFNQRPNTGQSQYGGNYLGPDGLSTINPDDIEDLTILKGPSAAALYGAQAANGAILITTKSGKEGRARINVSSNTTFTTPLYTPEMQTTYGGQPFDQGYGRGSWGEATPESMNAKNFYKDFLQTGLNTMNAVNFSVGNKMGQVFTSYANTYGRGLIPNNTLMRHNFDLKGDANFFNKVLEVGAKVSYTQQTLHNPYATGSDLNPYLFLIGMSANVPLADYRDYDKGNNQGQNWIGNDVNLFGNSPYWIANRVRPQDDLSRILASANLKVNFTDWLSLMGRGTIDQTNQVYTMKMYKGTNPTLAGQTGAYQKRTTEIIQYYGDAILNFNKDLIKEVVHLNAFVGGSIRDYNATGMDINSGIGRGGKDIKQLYVSDIFTENNIDFGNTGTISPNFDRKQIQSVFYSLEFSYKNALFLTHTGRNDWSSTLPADQNNYYYPSIGASAVLTELIESIQSPTLNYLKVRASFTQVGNDLPSFIINPLLTVAGNTGTLGYPSTIVKPGIVLKPEMTSSMEIGLDFGMFNNLVKFEGTYYKTNTTNQLFTVMAPASSGFEYYYVNGGNIQNQGIELSLSVSPKLGPVQWMSSINFSRNVNKVISLVDGVDELIYSQLSNSSSYYQKILPGGTLGDIYTTNWDRNSHGSIKMAPIYVNGVATESGGPVIQKEAQKIGTAFPDFLLSWGNTFTYKGVRLSFLIDGRFGGKIISLTQQALDASGNSLNSARDRDRGYVDIGGGKTFGTSYADIQSFYQTQAGIAGPLGEYAYDATVIRLREISLSYSFGSLLEKTKAFQYIKDISISFIARNLFYFYKPAPIDPEVVSNNAQGQNAYLGLELYNLPATRNFGFGVNFIF
ncbi:MAG: SusC/RagA family TonB-linked outer membrane protein, partial [Chitinophagaceae bacterium]